MKTFEEERAEFLEQHGVKPDELQHAGVKGMRWGYRKGRSSQTKAPRKPLTKEQKELVVSAALLGTAVALKSGAAWMARNPDKVETILARTTNTIRNTKEIGIGYEIVKTTLTNIS